LWAFHTIQPSSLRPVFAASPVQHVSDLHPKFAPYADVWQTSNLGRLRLGEEKRKIEGKKSQGKNIMACPITQGGNNQESC